jgi:hypothetical protein
VNCKKLRRLLPLMVGYDIPSSKISAMKRHIERCQACQREYYSYLKSTKKIGELLLQDRIDWEDKEWQRIVQKAVKEEKQTTTSLAPWPFHKAWAYALIAILVTALSFFFILNSSFLKEKLSAEYQTIPETQKKIFKIHPETHEQDVISMTIISKESGLKIVWFLNKHYKLEVQK